jgi:RNA polymerase sigma-70 factor (ECF subfamily)
VSGESISQSGVGLWSRTSTAFLRALKVKDDAAWERVLVRACWHVYAVVGAAGLSQEDAEDVIQDVLLAASQSFPNFEHSGRQGAFRAWLTTIVRRRLSDKCRERRAQLDPPSGGGEVMRVLANLAGEAAVGNERPPCLISEEILERVRAGCAPENWDAFCRQVYEGQTADQVAEELGVTINQAYLAKSRIVRRLRDAVESEGQRS